MLSGERVREANSFVVEASLPARFTFRSRRTALVPNSDPTRISAETLVLIPELGPRHPWRAAHKNVGMILAFLVPHAIGICDMAGHPARGQCLLHVFTRLSKDNHGRWRLRRISAQPRRVGPADRCW